MLSIRRFTSQKELVCIKRLIRESFLRLPEECEDEKGDVGAYILAMSKAPVEVGGVAALIKGIDPVSYICYKAHERSIIVVMAGSSPGGTLQPLFDALVYWSAEYHAGKPIVFFTKIEQGPVQRLAKRYGFKLVTTQPEQKYELHVS